MGAVRPPKILVLTIDDFVSAQSLECEAFMAALHLEEAVRQLQQQSKASATTAEAKRPVHPDQTASRSVRRALLTPQANPGSGYHRGKRA